LIIVIGLAGNKSDLIEKEEVTDKEAKDYAKEIDAIFQLTSAFTSIGIEELFISIGCKLLESNYKNNDIPKTVSLDKKKAKNDKKKKKCC